MNSRGVSLRNYKKLIQLKRCEHGFTMIEIMLVVVIIGILAAMVIPNLSGRSKQARVAAARADINGNISAALDLYELDNGTYPTTEQGLKALLKKPTSAPLPNDWNGPYLKNKKYPMDPWNREYIYVSPGINNPEDYDLSCYGHDGVASDDDIVNWIEESE